MEQVFIAQQHHQKRTNGLTNELMSSVGVGVGVSGGGVNGGIGGIGGINIGGAVAGLGGGGGGGRCGHDCHHAAQSLALLRGLMRGFGRQPSAAIAILRRLSDEQEYQQQSRSQSPSQSQQESLPWRSLVALLVESCAVVGNPTGALPIFSSLHQQQQQQQQQQQHTFDRKILGGVVVGSIHPSSTLGIAPVGGGGGDGGGLGLGPPGIFCAHRSRRRRAGGSAEASVDAKWRKRRAVRGAQRGAVGLAAAVAFLEEHFLSPSAALATSTITTSVTATATATAASSSSSSASSEDDYGEILPAPSCMSLALPLLPCLLAEAFVVCPNSSFEKAPSTRRQRQVSRQQTEDYQGGDAPHENQGSQGDAPTSTEAMYDSELPSKSLPFKSSCGLRC